MYQIKRKPRTRAIFQLIGLTLLFLVLLLTVVAFTHSQVHQWVWISGIGLTLAAIIISACTWLRWPLTYPHSITVTVTAESINIDGSEAPCQILLDNIDMLLKERLAKRSGPADYYIVTNDGTRHALRRRWGINPSRIFAEIKRHRPALPKQYEVVAHPSVSKTPNK